MSAQASAPKIDSSPFLPLTAQIFKNVSSPFWPRRKERRSERKPRITRVPVWLQPLVLDTIHLRRCQFLFVELKWQRLVCFSVLVLPLQPEPSPSLPYFVATVWGTYICFAAKDSFFNWEQMLIHSIGWECRFQLEIWACCELVSGFRLRSSPGYGRHCSFVSPLWYCVYNTIYLISCENILWPVLSLLCL